MLSADEIASVAGATAKKYRDVEVWCRGDKHYFSLS
jgi:hypothetical protein